MRARQVLHGCVAQSSVRPMRRRDLRRDPFLLHRHLGQQLRRRSADGLPVRQLCIRLCPQPVRRGCRPGERMRPRRVCLGRLHPGPVLLQHLVGQRLRARSREHGLSAHVSTGLPSQLRLLNQAALAEPSTPANGRRRCHGRRRARHATALRAAGVVIAFSLPWCIAVSRRKHETRRTRSWRIRSESGFVATSVEQRSCSWWRVPARNTTRRGTPTSAATSRCGASASARRPNPIVRRRATDGLVNG